MSEAGQDPLRVALKMVKAVNQRDVVRYRATLSDTFRGESDGWLVASTGDEDGIRAVRSWAAHPDAHVVVEDAEVVGGFVLLRYRVVDGDRSAKACSVLELRGSQIVRAWRYGVA